MKITTAKKLLAICLAGVMALCLLAGCGNEPATQTGPATKEPVPAGILILSAGASLSISYDADGAVLDIYGNNNPGIVLAGKYTDYSDKTCAAVAKDLIAAAAGAGYLSAEVKNIVIKQSLHSQLPGSDFLETVEAEVKTAAEAASSAAVITVIDETMLDERGYINLDTAKALLCNELGVEKLDKYYGDAAPFDGSYICTVEIAGVQTSHNIDAVTGLIAEATEEELLGNPDEDIEETQADDLEDIEEPTDDHKLPTENIVTPPAVQPTEGTE